MRHFFELLKSKIFLEGPPRFVVCPPPPPPPVIASKMHPFPAFNAGHLYAFQTTTTIQVEWLGLSFSKILVDQ